jgi:hypothetical protein
MRSDSYALRKHDVTERLKQTEVHRVDPHRTLGSTAGMLACHLARLRWVCGNGRHLSQMSEEALLLHAACCFLWAVFGILSLHSVEW